MNLFQVVNLIINGFKSIDCLDQLNLDDQIKFRRLLMLELTALLDKYGFKVEKLMNKRKSMQRFFNKNKERKNSLKSQLFGVPLDELLEKDRVRLDNKSKIPIVLNIVSLLY